MIPEVALLRGFTAILTLLEVKGSTKSCKDQELPYGPSVNEGVNNNKFTS